jgi:aminoglycoside phosphotransferase (APT) family kinase protein
MPLRTLFGRAGLRRSRALLTSTGRWLRRLHGIRPNGLVPRETVRPADARRGIRQELDRLERSGAPLDRGWWTRQLDRLGPDAPSAESVWLHGDFHLGNVQVDDDGRVVALDTALLRRGSAHADVGKFLADLKTRRGRILRRGWIPGRRTTDALERAFLEGYFGAETSPDLATLRLFEGWYLLRKWRRVRTDTARGVSAAGRAADALLRVLAIDPAYRRIATEWAETLPARKSRQRG